MANKSLLNRIDVKSPCNESWDEMVGNNEVRFCSHCAKDVHDLSAMKRADAEKLVQKSSGKLCVRYVKNSTGKLITAQPKFTQIKRRATIAASVLATSLTFTTLAYAQGEPIVRKDNITQTNKDKIENNERKQGVAIISGEIQDENGALVPEATIRLRNINTNKIRETYSNNEGFYEFIKLEPSVYEIQVEVRGFKKLTINNLEIEKDTKLTRVFNLQNIGEVVGELIVVDEPITTTQTKPIETFQEKKVADLPRNPETSFMGDMTMPIDSKLPDFLVKLEPIKPKKKKKKN
jgi:Carboxypeptidase regulatory-like domain